MSETREMAAGGYAYIPGVFQYSAGVSALDGFRIERARFSRVLSMKEGFARIKDHLGAVGRPLTAFCACELRSPAPFSEAGFRDFNRAYADTLQAWGIMRDETNPVARANVCPEIDPPAEPGFHAFCYTVAYEGATPSFVVAGSGEVPEGQTNYHDHIVRRGEQTTAALREKARFVLGEMERRMAALGGSWADTTAVQMYSIHDIHPFFAEELVRRGAAQNGLTWHYNRPPVVDLEYEMDCRRVHAEHVIDA